MIEKKNNMCIYNNSIFNTKFFFPYLIKILKNIQIHGNILRKKSKSENVKN